MLKELLASMEELKKSRLKRSGNDQETIPDRRNDYDARFK